MRILKRSILFAIVILAFTISLSPSWGYLPAGDGEDEDDTCICPWVDGDYCGTVYSTIWSESDFGPMTPARVISNSKRLGTTTKMSVPREQYDKLIIPLVDSAAKRPPSFELNGRIFDCKLVIVVERGEKRDTIAYSLRGEMRVNRRTVPINRWLLTQAGLFAPYYITESMKDWIDSLPEGY